ncbi:MAG: hypothetical protein MUE56_00850 [Ignavibacteria bacterium]|jgi:hypothetical protein|nr:hypothetical protein [Ignavibacteria bacterium]
MDMLKTGILIKSALIVLILLIFELPAYSQNQNLNNNAADTVDDEEDLFDENTDYKQMYKDLNKDGDWLTMKESELDTDTEEGEEVNGNSSVTYYRIINVWRPRGMGPDWSPYSEGRWVYTYSGWIWVTAYDWGWAAYHYGRWVFSPVYGWVWIPGRYWAPNWVQWGYNRHCIGWYPVYPRWRGWHHGRHHHRWHDRFYHRGRHHHWVFVNRDRFTEKVNENTRLDPNGNKQILEGAKTKVIVKFDGKDFVNVGPKVETIEKNTGQKIQPKEINLNPTKGITKVDDNSVSMYRNESPKNKNTRTDGTGTFNNGSKNKDRNNDGEDIKKKDTGNGNTENGQQNREDGQKNRENGENNSDTKQNFEKNKQRETYKEGNTNPPGSNEGSRENNRGNEGTKYEGKKEMPPDGKEYNKGSRNNEGGRNNEGSRNNESGRNNEGKGDSGNRGSKPNSRK